MRQLGLPLFLLVFAATTLDAGEPLTIGETVRIHSKILDEDRTVFVSTPRGYEQGRERYPLLYITDGDAHLLAARGVADFLASNGLMPPVIIVGLANTDRTRDLTPTRANTPDRDGTLREHPTSGGGDAFLDFFEKELFPWVDEHYRTHLYRLFAGHSFGGLLGLHVLATRPDMFGGVVAVSPSLRWDDDLPLREVAALLEKRKRLDSVLFVSMANEESDLPSPTHLDRLEQILRSSKVEGFGWQIRRFPDETHASVVLRALYWGLRRLFRPWLLPLDPATGRVKGDLDGLKEHYARLSERGGFDVVPPELTVNLLGYQLLGAGDLQGALEVFRYNVELHPDAPNVHDSLGEALERAGRLTEAFSSYARAVDRASATKDPLLETFKAHRDRLKDQL